MATNQERESATPAMLLWQTASQFLHASKKLGTDYVPARYLACHGIELALKSHLRARGYRLGQLIDIGHSIDRALRAANSTGMKQPPMRVLYTLEFAEEIHFKHEYRYPHLHRPKFIESVYLIYAGAWALREAADAVVEITLAKRSPGRGVLRTRMKGVARELAQWAGPKIIGRKRDPMLAVMSGLLAKQITD